MAEVSAEDMRQVSPGSQLKAQRPVRSGSPLGLRHKGQREAGGRGPWTGQPQWGCPFRILAAPQARKQSLTWDHPGSDSDRSLNL